MVIKVRRFLKKLNEELFFFFLKLFLFERKMEKIFSFVVFFFKLFLFETKMEKIFSFVVLFRWESGLKIDRVHVHSATSWPTHSV